MPRLLCPWSLDALNLPHYRASVASVLALVIIASGCGTSDAKTAGTAGTGTPPASSTPSTPTPNPSAKYDETCDLNLNSNYGSAPTGWLVADAELHNTGNIGVRVKVTAVFKQAGSGPITISKMARLAYHHSHAVHFKMAVDSNQVDSFQSAPGYFNNKACAVNAKLIGTFGAAH